MFVSDDPDDAGVDLRSPRRPGLLAVTGVAPERRVFIHVFDPDTGFVVGAERLVPVPGTRNVRDLGGFPLSAGGATRWGRVFRADRPGAPAGRHLAALGVVRAIDFRSDAERAAEPSDLVDHPDIEVHELAISSDPVQQRTQFDRLLAGEITKFGVDEMAELYATLLADHSSTFVRAVELVATAPGPVVFHCAGGKDRTGLTSALILSTLGVSRASVLDDYELTERAGDPSRHAVLFEQLRAAGVNPDDVGPYLGARRSVMARTVDHLESRYEGAEGYLRQHGMVDEVVLRLRARLCD